MVMGLSQGKVSFGSMNNALPYKMKKAKIDASSRSALQTGTNVLMQGALLQTVATVI